MEEKRIDPEIEEAIFTFHQNVKYLREQHGLTIKQMADIIKISEKGLIMVEACNGTKYFHGGHIVNLCNYFHINADDLFFTKHPS